MKMWACQLSATQALLYIWPVFESPHILPVRMARCGYTVSLHSVHINVPYK